MIALDANVENIDVELNGEQYQRTLNFLTYLTSYQKKLSVRLRPVSLTLKRF